MLNRVVIGKTGSFRSEYGPDPLTRGSETRIDNRNYTRPGSRIKTALPQATITSPGPVNWGVYPTVSTPAALGSTLSDPKLNLKLTAFYQVY